NLPNDGKKFIFPDPRAAYHRGHRMQADAFAHLAKQLLFTVHRNFTESRYTKQMKHFFRTILLSSLALTGPMLVAQENPQARQTPTQSQAQKDSQQTTTGKITQANDGKYVLVDSAGKLYQLDDQKAAEKFNGKNVKVSGTVDTSSN